MRKANGCSSLSVPRAAFLAVLAAWTCAAQLTVSLATSAPSGQLAGTEIRLDATLEGAEGALPYYQFSYRQSGQEDWSVLRDYSIWRSFGWSPIDEGDYELRVLAGAIGVAGLAEIVEPFSVSPRVSFFPAVAPTTHPLVAIYSAPACTEGVLWVRFKPMGGPFWETTSAKACDGRTINIYVGGMRANTTYSIQHERLSSNGLSLGPALLHRTGVPAASFPTIDVAQAADLTTSLGDDVLLFTHVIETPDRNFPFATDLAGNVIWYYEALANSGQVGAIIPRALPGGTFLVIMNGALEGQVLREIDLAGNILRETNAIAISTRLAAMGEDRITSFHHEAIRLPNGHILVIGAIERILTDVQGPGDVNVYGEIVIELDSSFQPTWVWNSFDHLDSSRSAVLGEVCEFQGPGCPPLFRGATANDWLHANSIDYVPEDGNLLLSLRHQDWVVKVDYRDGLGSGDVIWRLGREGDFTLVGGDESDWFSHQHDAELAGDLLTLYDNGNTRVAEDGSGNSRGQVWQLDEISRTARLVENFDLGHYSFALGSAQRLRNGNYHFGSGFIGPREAPVARAIEFAPGDAAPKFVIEANGAAYRSFRMKSLYRPELE